MGKGDYWLTRGAAMRYFKITKQKFNQMLNTPQGKYMHQQLFYPRAHSSFVEWIY
jgi:hypothetical protein